MYLRLSLRRQSHMRKAFQDRYAQMQSKRAPRKRARRANEASQVIAQVTKWSATACGALGTAWHEQSLPTVSRMYVDNSPIILIRSHLRSTEVNSNSPTQFRRHASTPKTGT